MRAARVENNICALGYICLSIYLFLGLPFRAREDTDLWVTDKVYNNHWPRWVRWDCIIKLWCECPQSWQPRPGDRGEVVVFIVIPHLFIVSDGITGMMRRTNVIGQGVEGAVVRVGFLVQAIP